MAFEVHSGMTVAHPRRALWTAILLLAGTMALAASMTAARRSDPLGARFEPPGWPLSFRVPRSFDIEEMLVTAHGPAIQLVHATGPTHPIAMMTVRVIPTVSGETAAELAWSVLTHDGVVQRPQFANADEAPPTGRQPLGQLDGVEARNHVGTAITRAAIGSSGDGLAVTLFVDGAVIDPSLYRLFDLVCRSVEFVRTGV